MSETRIGPYTILRLVKRGGQGRVYLGYDRRLRRQVAIKIHGLPRGRAQRRQALAEARRAAGMNDPRVVQIYDLLESRGHLAIVMEYVPGCDLEELLQNTRLSVPAALRIGADLAAALAAARQEKVVHGDIKAANVLITPSGRAKLTDFGIARQARDETQGSTAYAGSPTSVAPEVLQGALPDMRSDMFALGCLLYRMLTGEHAFCPGGRLDTELLLHGEPPPLAPAMVAAEEPPGDMLVLLGELLQKSPDNRPQNTHRVRSLMRTAMRGIPLSRVDSLAAEARPYFRPESSDDIPLRIPSDLRHGGRSRLVRRGLELWVQRYLALRLSTRMLIAVSVPLVLFAAVDVLRQQTPLRVHFDSPRLDYAQVSSTPDEVNGSWLMEAIYDAVSDRVGPMQVSGAVQPRSYYSEQARLPPQETIDTSLRCSEMLCVLLVSRRGPEGYRYQQALFPPQLPLQAWRKTVIKSVAALYP